MKNKLKKSISKKKAPSSPNINTSSHETLSKSEVIDFNSISSWSTESTVKWLKYISYGECENNFTEHNINGRALLMLNEEDLKEIIKNNVGKRKNLYHLIKILQIRYNRYMNANVISTSDEDELSNDSEIEEFESRQKFDELNSTKLKDKTFDNLKEDQNKISQKTFNHHNYEIFNSTN